MARYDEPLPEMIKPLPTNLAQKSELSKKNTSKMPISTFLPLLFSVRFPFFQHPRRYPHLIILPHKPHTRELLALPFLGKQADTSPSPQSLGAGVGVVKVGNAEGGLDFR